MLLPCVEEPNPLKQGLKLDTSFLLCYTVHVEEPNPLKQGLKLHQPNGLTATAEG